MPTQQELVWMVKRAVSHWGGYQGVVIFDHPLDLYAGAAPVSTLRGVLNGTARTHADYQNPISVAAWAGVSSSSMILPRNLGHLIKRHGIAQTLLG